MNIALLGLGTVGSGVVNVLTNNSDKITKLTDEKIIISHILVSDVDKQRDADTGAAVITDDVNDIIEDDTIDIVIEVMGGIEKTKDLLQSFLKRGVHVVSANKDMLAEHIDVLTETANENNATLAYEASVAGGLPIVRSIENSLNSNRITKVLGILNGTTNYILSKMAIDGWEYNKALADAKEKGYAETDPTNDVEGIDAKRKIVLLSRLAYDRKINMSEVQVRGISDVSIVDIDNAARENLTLKLLGKSTYDAGGLCVSVEPVLLPSTHQLASVNYEMNAVYVNGNAVGETMFYGPGAGSLQTASAVVSDLINVIRYKDAGVKNFAPDETVEVNPDSGAGRHYIRFANEQNEAEAALNGMSVEFKIVDSDEFVIITEAITNKQLDDLKADRLLDIKASYQIDGVE
ncbi:homoserine dehydrogenase [Salinicoccus albus]|uniref:homoserine dehydrogenase n=1 Tax=Salinicoccus albus TaxID=418756 RepID=UPI000361832A|nr:homoserine dehydrogenase [Salinicoccus albus]